MEKEKMNCWEIEECGLEPGGKNVSARGICPAAVEQRADGIHQGVNAGRCCWVVTRYTLSRRSTGKLYRKNCGLPKMRFLQYSEAGGAL